MASCLEANTYGSILTGVSVSTSVLCPLWRGPGPRYTPSMAGDARPPDDRDAAVEIARELVRLGSELSALKGEATNWLAGP